MNNLIEDPFEHIRCDKDGIAGEGSSINIEMLEALWKKHYKPPCEVLKAIYIWEGSHDHTHPNHWRNRPAFKAFLEKAELEIAPGATSLIPAGSQYIIGGTPLVVSMAIPPGKMLFQMGDGSMKICDESPETEV